MSDFNINNLEGLENPSYSRSIKLLDAIQKNNDYEFLGAKLWKPTDDTQLELLIVTLTCDGVPNANLFGINYRERIGIVVGSEECSIPEVWALREDFPCMLHMNDRLSWMPHNLCLYFENKTVINRTWTAERFLKRIYWWIEQSAKGLLHASDQPLEQLFFNSRYELIFPKESGQNLENLNENAYISHLISRDDDTYTYFLEFGKQKNATVVPVHLIFLELPPVVSETISPSPHKLSELFDLTSSATFSTKDFLKEHIQSLVMSTGQVNESKEQRTIVLVKAPIARSAGGKVERVQLKAFLSLDGPLEIGVKMGILFQSPEDDKLYKEVNLLGAEPPTEDVYLEPVEVLVMNSKDDFREQSGSATCGGKYVLIGLGALGSALIDLWSRAGWGEWTLIDKDHIKPHNLTRHTATKYLVGWNKAKACEALIESSTGITEGLKVFEKDVMSINRDIDEVLADTDLVIDVSTTLDYPRAASFKDEYSRHCSLFITPSGNDSVLLLEDKERKTRLRTLEAQYYREVLNNDWGIKHLGGHLGRFISGASCRDISFKMPFSSIMSHAATLSEQVMWLSENDEPKILIWKKNKLTGVIEVVNCLVYEEIYIEFSGYKIIYDKGLEEKLKTMRSESLPVETGGVLLGYHDLNLNSIFIVDALPAPPDSVSTETEFQRGTLGTLDELERAREKTAYIIDYIGEWHTHPKYVNADPSLKDVIQLTELSKILSEDGLPAIQVIVGENGVNVIVGELVNAE